MKNKHQKNAYPTKKFNCLMRVISGVLDLEYFEKNIFGHFFAVLGLIKSEDLSEQKMTKLLKGAIVLFSNLVILFSNLGKAASIRGVS